MNFDLEKLFQVRGVLHLSSFGYFWNGKAFSHVLDEKTEFSYKSPYERKIRLPFEDITRTCQAEIKKGIVCVRTFYTDEYKNDILHSFDDFPSLVEIPLTPHKPVVLSWHQDGQLCRYNGPAVQILENHSLFTEKFLRDNKMSTVSQYNYVEYNSKHLIRLLNIDNCGKIVSSFNVRQNLEKAKEIVCSMGGANYLDYNQLHVQDIWDTFYYSKTPPHWMGVCLMAIIDHKYGLSFHKIPGILSLTVEQTSNLIQTALENGWIQYEILHSNKYGNYRSYIIGENNVFKQQIFDFKSLAMDLQSFILNQRGRSSLTVNECSEFELLDKDPTRWENQIRCLLAYLTECQDIKKTGDDLYHYDYQIDLDRFDFF